MRNAETSDRPLGLLNVVSIGIGGMVGGGIFAVLGLAVQLARGATPIAFLLAGLVALLTGYSYARLSVAIPSDGGTVEFINRAFGAGLFTGSANVLLWISYIVMLSLYAFAFGSYGASVLPGAYHAIAKHAFISGAIVAFTVLNLVGSKAVGRAEEWIVGIKLLILVGFAAVGVWGIEPARLAPAAWSPPVAVFAGGMVIFLAYEGFELIANSARDVRDPARTLPRAFYASIAFVIVLYVLVAAVTVGNLSVGQIVSAKDYALAEAARPFLGQAGFTLIAVAAVLSTGSAINATLYGAARVSYVIAKDGELPEFLERKVWHRPAEGLLITAGVTLAMANLLDLSSLSTMGSAGFLILFAVVNASHFRLAVKTGGSRWLSGLGAVASLCALAALIWHAASTNPRDLWILVGMLALSFAVEAGFRLAVGREIRPQSERDNSAEVSRRSPESERRRNVR